MKRKEIADLIRSYRKNENVIDIITYKSNEHYQMVSLSFKDTFTPPEEAVCITLFSHRTTHSTRISFGIKFKNK